MTNNIGKGFIHYKVTDPNDDPINPQSDTLRYGASVIQGKVWITFKKDMNIKLMKPLLISSFTTIDGREFNVHIVTVSKIWIDHNTLYNCEDGLLDVTRGSANVTISNNWFREQDKVILLGHDDGYVRDINMKVTFVYNHFGPNCNQRMPRIHHRYAHVANNLYLGWMQYVIDGSMGPSLKSESNLFIAPKCGSKEVTWRKIGHTNGDKWQFHSVRDAFENGASFEVTKGSVCQSQIIAKNKFFKLLMLNQ
ncbi:putative pectate lyase [Medicago truncatula]|uniref:Putative pectate lyase n=1 Tax=Medicago truncatula TaxID=3880 RepID=A0A396HIW0_MEDTR|nr:putative pectate lyase [Medicago truncatula]